MKEELYDRAWRLGIWLRNVGKRLGVLGIIEPALLRLAPLIIPPPTKDVDVALPWEMKMLVPAGFPSARSYATHSYEPAVTTLFRRIVGKGATVVDLGANVGYYTLLASQLTGPSGQVYAFEPVPSNYAYLVRNISANGCLNVRGVGKAVSNRMGTASFILDDWGAEGSLSATEPADDAGSIAVQTVTLDDFFAHEGWPSVDLVKMDIEGAESAALDGMRELSLRNPALQLIMESNPGALRRAGGTVEALGTALQRLGFSHGYVIEQGMQPFSLTDGLPTDQAVYNFLLVK